MSVNATAVQGACNAASESTCEHLCRSCCDPAALSQAAAAGLSFSTILALLIQYGPQVMAIIQQIIDSLKPKTP